MVRERNALRRWSARIVMATIPAIAFVVLGVAGTGEADEGCNGVFSGKTPDDPITQTANKASIEIGTSVTFTVGWHSTGARTANVRDCFRIGDGSNAALSALVEGWSSTKVVDNVGAKGSAQSTTFTITVPDNADLVGQTLSARAKIKHGSRESRSLLLSIPIVGHPVIEKVEEEEEEETEVGGIRTVRRPRVFRGHLAMTGNAIPVALFGGLAFLLAGATMVRLTRRERIAVKAHRT